MINEDEVKIWEVPYSIPFTWLVGNRKNLITLKHNFDYYVNIQKAKGSDFDFNVIRNLFMFLNEYHVWIAGGLIRKLICEQVITKENTDIDIWSPTPDNLTFELEKFIGYTTKTSAWAYHHDYDGHQVQIIRKKFASVKHCLEYFDFTCCKLALLRDGTIVSNAEYAYERTGTTADYLRDINKSFFTYANNPVVDAKEGLLKLSTTKDKVIHPNRFVKYLKYGYYPEDKYTELLLEQYIQHGEEYSKWDKKGIPGIVLSTDKSSGYGLINRPGRIIRTRAPERIDPE